MLYLTYKLSYDITPLNLRMSFYLSSQHFYSRYTMFHKLNTATTSELYISAQHISGKMHVEYCRIQLNSYRNSLEELKNTNTVLQEHINRLTKSQEEQILQLIAKSEEAERIRISAVEHSEALRKSTDSLKTDYEESDRYTIKL